MDAFLKLIKNKNIQIGLVIAGLVVVNFFLLNLFFKTPASPIPTSISYEEIQKQINPSWDFRDLSNFFSDLAKTKGGEHAYKSLAFAALNSKIPPNIDLHLLGHVVGDELFKQQGLDGIKYCTNDLRNACSHSIVVGAFLESGSDIMPKIKEACHKAPGGRGAYTMCIHGLGHGLLAYTEYDMAAAIKLCEKVSTPSLTSQEYTECTGGIAMEMMSGVNDPIAWQAQLANYFKPDDPLSPCDMDFLPDAAEPSCYNFLTPKLFEAAGTSLGNPDPKYYAKAFSFCARINQKDTASLHSCYGGFGKEFPTLANDRNIENVTLLTDDKLKLVYTWCEFAPNQFGRQACLNSGLQSLYWGGENDKQVAIRYCTQISNTTDQDFCFESLIQSVGYYSNEKNYKQEFCDEIPTDKREKCKKVLLPT